MGAVLSVSPIAGSSRFTSGGCAGELSADRVPLTNSSRLTESKSAMGSIMGEDNPMFLFTRNGFKNSILNSISLRRLNFRSFTKSTNNEVNNVNNNSDEDDKDLITLGPLKSVQRSESSRNNGYQSFADNFTLNIEDNFEINNNTGHQFLPPIRISSSFRNTLKSSSLKKCSSCQTLHSYRCLTPVRTPPCPPNENNSPDSISVSHDDDFSDSSDFINNNALPPSPEPLPPPPRAVQPLPTKSFTTLTHRTVYQTKTTAELLRCLGTYLACHCPHFEISFQPSLAVSWVQSIDRALIYQGWAEIAFINPVNVVFLFLLVRDFVSSDIQTERELQSLLQTCLYLAYAYMGNEISYPLKPFLLEEDREEFWKRCLRVIEDKSSDMLRINGDEDFFMEVFTELNTYTQNF